ncbi:hypothetical protein GOP47_0017010 [Adiantum capillus-veneris]|uniref:Pentatricopeptide repeat-containing protein n=1 Tax=Adiantum capillus-veneris TaxID=13818 RepID=A0A9D4ZCN9_ADICA|nr:hypothetical protein GOP47_0017010 [Adiantum capillus-veneris]
MLNCHNVSYSKDRLTPDESIALVAALKDCTLQKNLYNGSKLHADILKQGFLKGSLYVSSSLLNMYAKCGALAKAQQVFDDLSTRNVVTWNALITAYAQHEQVENALNCFEEMQCEGIFPNDVTFISLLKACSTPENVGRGIKIHDKIIKQGLLGKKTVIGTALLDMYAKVGDLHKAQHVFDELPLPDVIAWNALIAGYSQHGRGKEALDCFERMQSEGLTPSATTFSCILKACGTLGAIGRGKEVHDQIAVMGLLTKNIVLGNALVDMYAKCGELSKAQEVFDKLPTHDVVSWTAIISGYCRHGLGKQALSCFESMQHEGLSPSPVTLLCILLACSTLKDLKKGINIHSEIVRKGLLANFTTLGNALVDMYAKCGAIGKAREVFDRILVRDKFTWTTLITAYCQQRNDEEALKCFACMQDEGLAADAVLSASILQACGSLSATQKGEFLHAAIVREGFLSSDSVLGTALVDFYAKCNALAKAHIIFDELFVRSVVTWNVLIGGYAEVGKHEAAFEMFRRMTGEGVEPDLVTFIVVLNACSYVGLVVKGQMFLEMMSVTYGIVPNAAHHSCIVDLLGHAGHFDKAMSVIENMPSSGYIQVWLALLGACQKWGNVEVGRLSFERAVLLDKKCAVAYMCMIDIYTDAGMQKDANKIEVMRLEMEEESCEPCICGDPCIHG